MAKRKCKHGKLKRPQGKRICRRAPKGKAKRGKVKRARRGGKSRVVPIVVIGAGVIAGALALSKAVG